jgi:prepilin signal peptidase PulO-like enzyme (type II secretory pathway)
LTTLFFIFVILMGACIGSFLNVVIYRLPRGESIVFPGSHCPSCGWAIRWYDNLPVFSWFILGGRCRKCQCFISPRYVIVEAATAIRVGGLFACYYIYRLRSGAGEFTQTAPMFAAHASLLCGLLACAIVDAEHYHIPLEVMWVCSVAGLLAAAAPSEGANPFLATVSPPAIAVGVAAAVGLVVSLILQSRGFLQPSFIDAEDAPARPATQVEEVAAETGTAEASDTLAASQVPQSVSTDQAAGGALTPPEAESPAPSPALAAKTQTESPDHPPEPPSPAKPQTQPQAISSGVPATTQAAPPTPSATTQARPPTPPRPMGFWTLLHILVGTVTAATLTFIPGVGGKTEDSENVAYSTDHGIRPRREILWEIAFLLPPIFLASIASLLLRHVPAAASAWNRLFDSHVHPELAPHLVGLGSAIFGYIIGGLWVWATRILGTLAFNKEAMGLGDVHILAAIGAVTGWIVPSLTFFITPFIGLGWALYVWIGRKQGVIAYGPLLATGCLAVMLFYDSILARIYLLLYGGH